jgi:hypothetical protein
MEHEKKAFWSLEKKKSIAKIDVFDVCYHIFIVGF